MLRVAKCMRFFLIIFTRNSFESCIERTRSKQCCAEGEYQEDHQYILSVDSGRNQRDGQNQFNGGSVCNQLLKPFLAIEVSFINVEACHKRGYECSNDEGVPE